MLLVATEVSRASERASWRRSLGGGESGQGVNDGGLGELAGVCCSISIGQTFSTEARTFYIAASGDIECLIDKWQGEIRVAVDDVAQHQDITNRPSRITP
jgi:hypothetical protein